MTSPRRPPTTQPGAGVASPSRSWDTEVRPSPNIWHHPETYEVENRATDRAGVIEAALASLAPWADRDVLDIGCGTGFHLPRFAASARSVVGVEPHPSLLAIARRRCRRLPTVSVLSGRASDLPLAPASVDIAHARWAYFFGPGCEPGLLELSRVMRRGGKAFVIDNDPTRSTFGSWFASGYPSVDAALVERFWTSRGWSRERLDITWEFDSRADFESVVRIELPAGVAERVLASYAGTGADYAVNLWWKGF